MQTRTPPTGVGRPKAPEPETFGSAFGHAVWLMTMSSEHQQRSIGSLKTGAFHALLLKQFKLYFKRKQPVAFVAWAMMSDEIQEKFNKGEPLELADWRSGQNLVVVDCVAPFSNVEDVKAEFLGEIRKVVTRTGKWGKSDA